MATFVGRMIGAAKLDAATYEEIEADARATGQAMLVVCLSAVAAGIGAIGDGGVRGALGGVIAALLGWFLWALLTWVIGTKMLPEAQTSADLGQLLRTIGFSASPGILRLFGFIPVLGVIIQLAATIWMLAAMIVAVRQALDYRGTGRAIVVCLIGFLIYVAVNAALFMVLGLGAGMMGAKQG
jgi:hypothetical protein